jgi:hypothetical protein
MFALALPPLWPRGRFRSTSARAIIAAGLALAAVFSLGCELRTRPSLITVYNATTKVSLPVPQGWQSETAEQAGFQMQIFTGPSVDVPERPGIRAQVMAGPLPAGRAIDDIARRYTEGHTVSHEQGYSLHGFAGKSWFFVSGDGAERSQLMLTPIEDTLYGLYVRGEAPTVEAYAAAVAAMWEGFSVEEARFFEPFERADVGLALQHPRSWVRTSSLGDTGRSFFVSFRSPPVALESGGATIHATLEINVNTVPPDTTLESFYSDRVEIQGDTYRLLEHETIREGQGISDLYHVETQLADFLERTVYFVRGDKSYIFKFNARREIYRQIEGWIDEIVGTFEPQVVTSSE